MSVKEIKIYRIIGTYRKKYKKYLFRKEVRALKEKDALEDKLQFKK
jgi:ribosomal protein L20A (L18A)